MLRNLAAAALAAAVACTPAHAQSRGRSDGYFPNLPVVTQDGKTLKFYDDVVKGKGVLISFIYTNSPDIDPLTIARIAQLEDMLGDAVGRDVFFITLTVDPERDTPPRLKEFADAFGVGHGWLFLTGQPDDIRQINAKFGDRSRSLDDRRNEIVLGNDAPGEWIRNSVFGDLDRLVSDIRMMDSLRREPKVDAAINTGLPTADQAGQALFRHICTPCHTIGVGDRVGPDLRGVTERRDHAWLKSFIMRPDQARARRDPIAMALAEKSPGLHMPALGVDDTDAANLIAYLGARDALLKAPGIATPER